MFVVGLAALLWLRLSLLRPYGFTRGRASGSSGGTFYACEKFRECADEPVREADFKPGNVEYCQSHGLAMVVPVHRVLTS